MSVDDAVTSTDICTTGIRTLLHLSARVQASSFDEWIPAGQLCCNITLTCCACTALRHSLPRPIIVAHVIMLIIENGMVIRLVYSLLNSESVSLSASVLRDLPWHITFLVYLYFCSTPPSIVTRMRLFFGMSVVLTMYQVPTESFQQFYNTSLSLNGCVWLQTYGLALCAVYILASFDDMSERHAPEPPGFRVKGSQ